MTDLLPRVDDHMSDDDLTAAAKRIRAEIDWSRLPRLAAQFEHRPPVNRHWHELVALVLMTLESGQRLDREGLSATWTRVEDQLPEDGQRVLGVLAESICAAHGLERIQIVTYRREHGEFPDWGFVAWQPLPELPERTSAAAGEASAVASREHE